MIKMLDIKFLRENSELVKENIKVRGGQIKNVSVLEWLPQNSSRCISYSETVCLDQW